MMCCFTFSVTPMQAPCLMERTEHSRRFIPSLVQSRPRRYHPYGILGQYMDGYPTNQAVALNRYKFGIPNAHNSMSRRQRDERIRG
jgi:hypothetical protein